MAQLLKLILSGLKYNKLNTLQTKTEHYFAMKKENSEIVRQRQEF